MRRRTFLGFTLGLVAAPLVLPKTPALVTADEIRESAATVPTFDVGTVRIPLQRPCTLPEVVAALQQSLNRGTLSDDFGPRIGYLDAESLTRMRVVPSTYDGLAYVIGYGDLDALLHEGV